MLDALRQAGEVDLGSLVVPEDFQFTPSPTDPNAFESPVYEFEDDGGWFAKDVTDTDETDGYDWGQGDTRDTFFETIYHQAREKIDGFLDDAAEARGLSGLWNSIKSVDNVASGLKSAYKDFMDALQKKIDSFDGNYGRNGDTEFYRGIGTLDNTARDQVDGQTFRGLFDSLGFSIRETNSFQVVVHQPTETILGTEFRDAIYTGSLNQSVDAKGGDDLIINGVGGSFIVGGAGRDTVQFLENQSNYFVIYRLVTNSFSIQDVKNGSSDAVDAEIWMFKDNIVDLSNVNTDTPTRTTFDAWATPIELGTVVTGTSGPGFDSSLKTISIDLNAGTEYELETTVTGVTPIKPGSLSVTGVFNGIEIFKNDAGQNSFTPTATGTYTFDLLPVSSSGNSYTFEINSQYNSSWSSQPQNIELAAGIYQFFTGRIPEESGMEFLIDSNENPADLNDPYYAPFNIENRFINFANNLGSFGEGSASFQARFGSLTFEQTVRTAFEEIVGSQAPIDKGSDPEASISFFLGAFDFYAAVANERVVPSGIGFDQAVKVVAIGSILNEAFKSDDGRYHEAIQDVISDIEITGTSSHFGSDLFVG